MLTFFNKEFKKPVLAYNKKIKNIIGYYIEYNGKKVECSTWTPQLLPKIKNELSDPKLINSLNIALKNEVSVWDYKVPSPIPNVRFAFSSLLFLLQKNQTTPKILINGLLHAQDPKIHSQADKIQNQGIHVVKLKVTPKDHKKTKLFSSEFPFKIRLDANQNFKLKDAIKFCDQIENIEYFEEPVSHPNELEKFFLSTQVPFALDENLHFYPKIKNGLSALIIKPNLLGDFTDIKTFLTPNVPLIISSSYQTDTGLISLMHWAHFLNPTGHHGLGTFDIFKIPSKLHVTKGYLHET